jgi:hypothetical protein
MSPQTWTSWFGRNGRTPFRQQGGDDLTMGADFSKFQGVLRFVSQILPAENLKGFKTQPTTKSRNQNTRNERNGTTVCSLTSAALELQESRQSKQN